MDPALARAGAARAAAGATTAGVADPSLLRPTQTASDTPDDLPRLRLRFLVLCDPIWPQAGGFIAACLDLWQPNQVLRQAKLARPTAAMSAQSLHWQCQPLSVPPERDQACCQPP